MTRAGTTQAQAIGRTVLTPWQLRRCLGFWLPEEQYVIRDGSNRVSYVESLVPRARRVPLEQSISADRPTWNAAQAAYGGRPTLDFNGTSAFLSANALAAHFSGLQQPFTWIASANFAGGAEESMFSVGNSADNIPLHDLRQRPTGEYRSLRRTDNGSSNSAQSTSAEPSAAAVHSVVFDGLRTTWRRNGVAVPGLNGVSQIINNPMTVDRVGVGCLLRSIASGFFGGSIGGCGLYASALSDAERRIARSWMQRRFGL